MTTGLFVHIQYTVLKKKNSLVSGVVAHIKCEITSPSKSFVIFYGEGDTEENQWRAVHFGCWPSLGHPGNEFSIMSDSRLLLLSHWLQLMYRNLIQVSLNQLEDGKMLTSP